MVGVVGFVGVVGVIGLVAVETGFELTCGTITFESSEQPLMANVIKDISVNAALFILWIVIDVKIVIAFRD